MENKKCVKWILMMFVIVLAGSFQVKAYAYEKAWFPARVMNISQIAYEAWTGNGKNTDASHGTCNAIDILPGGNVFAPFTGKIVYVNTRWGYVLFQSIDRVYFADGSLDYMTVGFMHDSDISDLHVNQLIRQGTDFYQAGRMGNGNPELYWGAHVDISVFRGAINSVSVLGKGDTYAYDAFYINRNMTRSVINPGIMESGNYITNGNISDWSRAWRNLDSTDSTSPIISNDNTYYPACSSAHTSIVSALQSIGVDSSFSNRSNIAALNGISNYSGTSAQNIQMLNLLKQGKLVKEKKTVQADTTPPTISNVSVSDVSHNGYTITCIVTDNQAVDRVQFPTWTAYNDQDDIDGNWWTSAASRGSRSGDTYTFRVDGTSHNNECGDYVTHIYAFDSSGNYTSVAVPTVKVSDFVYNPGKTISDGIYNIVSTVDSNYEISVYHNLNDSGTNLHLWSRISTNKYSKFEFTYMGDGYYRIKSVGSGLVLDVWGAGGSGSNLVQHSSNGGHNQLFRVYPSSNGGYYLVPKNAQNCCIDLEGGKAFSGNNVRIWTENYSKAESWLLIKRESSVTAATKKNQTISANSVIKTYGNHPFLIGAKTSGNGKLTYKSSNTKIAAVSNSGKVTIKGIGIAKITITAAETSTYKKAAKTITVTVRPKSTTLSSLKNSKSKKLTIAWKRNSTVSGYIIQTATNSSFHNAKSYKVTGNRTLKKTISVSKGKTYYVRICTYKGSIQSAWSGVKKIKIRK
ncbi:MAG: RICIN domain-containing protein [Candidatus Limivivens sp.]|nr:RICIN domain-containing protein [Candidatus Limivivens sp.]